MTRRIKFIFKSLNDLKLKLIINLLPYLYGHQKYRMYFVYFINSCFFLYFQVSSLQQQVLSSTKYFLSDRTFLIHLQFLLGGKMY